MAMKSVYFHSKRFASVFKCCCIFFSSLMNNVRSAIDRSVPTKNDLPLLWVNNKAESYLTVINSLLSAFQVSTSVSVYREIAVTVSVKVSLIKDGNFIGPQINRSTSL